MAEHMKQLPKDVSVSIVDTIFKGKIRGLRNLASRQKRDGQWIDDNGVVALTTAHLLQRNIAVYSFPPKNSDLSLSATETMVDGGPGAASSRPIPVFYLGNHYQALKRKASGY